jgi:ankyrin repeat protein
MDKNGSTALHIAALYGHELLSGTLLNYGADPSKAGYKGSQKRILTEFFQIQMLYYKLTIFHNCITIVNLIVK